MGNLAATFCFAQQPAPAPSGMDAPWGVRKILDDLMADNEKLKSVLATLNPQEWSSKKGASTAYMQQLQMGQRQLNDVIVSSKLLAQKTESLPLALDNYFRLEALEVTARSLSEGALRYGDRHTADQLSTLVARSFTRRERLRDYIEDLANTREQNFRVADEEAQRCRGMISSQPAPSTRSRKH
ncbi:MAG TPA: hypothetical protein VH369_09035 [Bryobacteraceae bacterium]|jgi:hypothetical protein